MRKNFLLSCLLLLPSAVLAQSTVTVSSVYGPVEWKPATSDRFVALEPSVETVQLGDQIRTGPGGTLTLELPDSSYIVVSENSLLTIEEFWSASLRNIINLMMGKVRFYIQQFGGSPNPYRIDTPTALIAVRGTTFEVTVYDGAFTEVRCYEGRVAVESAGLPDREVILEAGKKTLVRSGEYPLMPVDLDDALAGNRIIQVVRRTAPDVNGTVAASPATNGLARDNDRRNRSIDIPAAPSRTTGEVLRAKPTLTFP